MKADGTLGGKGKPDPKDMYVDGIEYHLIAGGPEKHDPSLRYPDGSYQRKLYMLWRRIKCAVVGR